MNLPLDVNSSSTNQNCIHDLCQSEQDILDKGFVTYIYYNLKKKTVYIGETKHFWVRHDQHIHESHFNDGEFTNCLIVYNASFFTESHIKDLEFMIINHMLAETDETKFKIYNRNNGQPQPRYNEHHKVEQEVFVKLWGNELYNQGLVHTNDLERIRQKIIFKYSPFTQLSKQQSDIEERVIQDPRNKYLIEGGAGTGKTVLMMSLMYRLINKNPDMKIGLITTSNLLDKFNRILKQLNLKNKLTFVRAGKAIEEARKSNSHYDIILVDEAHRLQRYYPKGHPESKKHFDKSQPEINEIHMLQEITDGLVLFYDQFQSIRPQDVLRANFIKLTQGYVKESLSQQYRIKGDASFSGNDFLNGILYALDIVDEIEFNPNVFAYRNKDSYFEIVDSIQDLFKYIGEIELRHANTTNRVIAGYTREWISNPKSSQNKGIDKFNLPYDWVENESKWRWNSQYEKWVEIESSKNEIGSIHAIQGADIDHVGIIIGKDIAVGENGKLRAIKENYKDTGGTPLLNEYNEQELTSFILNIYYVLLTRGISGCRVYFEDSKVREYFEEKLSSKVI
ncbi:DNA/RNA helicase domain-containing protein [Paenibacillus polymyxa]|uniref:DNA/RNA helicase domain-containing protein n=1 Tax=Paenibacillus polymyxa TaxID=1406 RepID=UPI0008FC2C6F|nr:DNA/RNA helicase domain-containing protein [Paenibacillus polymyxa]